MKNLMKKTLVLFMFAIVAFGTATYIGGCKDDKDMEDVGDEAKEKMEETGDEIEEELD